MFVKGLPSAAVGVWADQATHPCALLQDGSVWCWGWPLGKGAWDGTTDVPAVLMPVQVKGLGSGVTALTTGGEWGMACALLVTGGVQCWGQSAGYLGDVGDIGGFPEYAAAPVDVLGAGVVELRSSDEGPCALMTTGDVKCWGLQAGAPVTVPGL